MSDPYRLSEAFEGQLYDRALSKHSFSAQLEVSPEGIRATAESQPQVHLSFRGMRVRRDAEGAIVCTQAGGKRRVRCADSDFLRALETSGGNDINDQLSRLAGLSTSNRVKHLAGCTLVLAVIGLVIWGVPKLFRRGVDATVDSVPYSTDEQLGEIAVENMEAGGPEVDDEVLRAAVQVMLDRLAPHRLLPEAEFRFRIIESELVNAYALPGGYITVFTGLLRDAERPEQVAGVLAHEIAHVTLRHGLRRVAHSLTNMGLLALIAGDVSGIEGILLEIFTMSTINAYSREQESAADLEGLRMLIAARIDPSGLAEFFELMAKEYGDVPDSLSWFSTHPQHKERIQALEAELRAARPLPDWEPLDLDWSAVQAALED